MRLPFRWPCGFAAAFVAAGLCGPAWGGPDRPYDFASAEHWVREQVPSGRVEFGPGRIEIIDAGGCTLWWRERIDAPVEIVFTVTALDQGRPGTRVSDINCFWMAREVDSDAPPYAPEHARSGRFGEYDTLSTYYVGLGGNNNSTTRFRRYDGTGARPLRPEHDLSEPEFLLEAGRPYRIRVSMRDGIAEYWRDGRRIFRFEDSSPLESGWFAFRTVRSHLLLEDFSVRRL